MHGMSSRCGLHLEEDFASSETPLDLSESSAAEICTCRKRNCAVSMAHREPLAPFPVPPREPCASAAG